MTQEDHSATVVLVTGATDGIGRETAIELLRAGASVIVHGRDSKRLASVVAAFESDHGARVLPPLCGDFARLDDVRAMTRELEGRPRTIDVLINNAGIFMNHPMRTAEGFEMTWGVNHLAPFLLTHLLLASSAGASLSRIVNVSSDAHRHGSVSVDDPGAAKMPFDRMGHYAGSKLANVLFTLELAARLEGRAVSVNSLHPGVVSTKLLTEGFGARGPDSLPQGAATSVWLALSGDVDGISGKYFERKREAKMAALCGDTALRRAFYEASALAVSLPQAARLA